MTTGNGHLPDDLEAERISPGDEIPILSPSRELRDISRDLQERAQQLRIRFEATHAAVLDALANEDYVTLRDMIEAERALIEEQALLMKEHTARAPRQRRV